MRQGSEVVLEQRRQKSSCDGTCSKSGFCKLVRAAGALASGRLQAVAAQGRGRAGRSRKVKVRMDVVSGQLAKHLASKHRQRNAHEDGAVDARGPAANDWAGMLG